MPHETGTGEGASAVMLWGMAGWVVGAVAQLQQPALWSPQVYALALLLAPVLWVGGRWAGRRRISGPAGRGVALALLVGVLLGFACTGLRAVRLDGQRLAPALEGRDLAVTGVVAAMPQRSDAGLRFRLAVEAAALDGSPVRLPGQLDLAWYGSWALADEDLPSARQPGALRAGERWQMTLRLKAAHGNLNPHGFDHELWLWEQGLLATGYVRAGPHDPVPRRLGQTGRHPVEAARQQVREAIGARMASDDPDRQRAAGILAALVTGEQGAIDRADWELFRATGVAHLMSISGLHITLFAWAAAALIGALWRRSARWGWRWCLVLPAPTAAVLGGVALAGAYAVFSGWGVPAQRTVWMLAAVAMLRLSGRRWPWPAVWLLACTAVVAIDPWALLQAGFWLSFVAVGVLFASGDGSPRAPADASAAPRRALMGLVRRAAALLREQWVVTLALTPLSLLLFGQVSLVGLLANAVAIPWVTLVVTPLALAGVLLPALWTLAAGALGPLLAGLQALAAGPWATVSVPTPPLLLAAAGVAGGVLLAIRLPWRVRALGLPMLLPVLLWQPPRPAPGHFELLAADVGQGNAVILRTATHTLVYDAGPRLSRESDAGHRVLVPLLRALGERVDTLVLSHRDSDHTGGARAVLAAQPQAGVLGADALDEALLDGRVAARCEAGQRWHWDGVQFEVLHPPAGVDRPTRSNASSCVLRVDDGAHSALLVGDIEAAQEAQLVASPLAPRLAADLLLVPHHGSKTSSSAEFLDAVRPRWALVQAGYRNRFGHPAAPVLARYQARDIAVIDSPHCGAAHWRSASPETVRCERDAASRYWHHRLP